MISFQSSSYAVGIISPILEFRVEKLKLRGHLPSHLWKVEEQLSLQSNEEAKQPQEILSSS